MKKAAFAILGACAFFVFPSCSKDHSDTSQNNGTKTSLLAQGTWQFRSATADGVDVSNDVLYFDPCEKDNVIDFTASGTGTRDEGATLCSADDPQTVSFTWTFQNNATRLNLSANLFSHGGLLFTVDSITDTELVLSQTFLVGGMNKNVTITFQH